jgi:hypothetical protein
MWRGQTQHAKATDLEKEVKKENLRNDKGREKKR